jgi:hypothetical protein
VGLASFSLCDRHFLREEILMTWTLTTDDAVIHVRAVIDVETEAKEIKDLIAALEKHLMKENTDGRPDPA